GREKSMAPRVLLLSVCAENHVGTQHGCNTCRRLLRTRVCRAVSEEAPYAVNGCTQRPRKLFDLTNQMVILPAFHFLMRSAVVAASRADAYTGWRVNLWG